MSADDISKNLQRLKMQILEDHYALAQHYGAKMEGEAKPEAPWTDRTAHARQGLFGEAMVDGEWIKVRLAHTMDYGVYLELARKNQGKYMIIRPVVQRNGPEFIQDAQELMKR